MPAGHAGLHIAATGAFNTASGMQVPSDEQTFPGGHAGLHADTH